MSDKLSPEHLEKDIEADRTALAETLGALSDHVSVDRWINEASQTLQTSGGDLVETVRRTARDNPGALVAAGAGVALLAYGVTRVAASQDDSPAHSIPATGPAQRIAEDGYVASRGNLRVATGGPAVAAQPGVDPLSPEFDARLRDADAALRASEPRLAEERADAWAADPWGATGDDLADTLGGNAQDQGMRETSGDTARDRLETRATEAREQIEARAATLRARIGDGLDTLNEEARNRVLQARAQAYEAQRAVEAAAEKSKTAFQQHPLAFGLGAVALGAVAAVLLPRSEAETARRAQQRDALMSRPRPSMPRRNASSSPLLARLPPRPSIRFERPLMRRARTLPTPRNRPATRRKRSPRPPAAPMPRMAWTPRPRRLLTLTRRRHPLRPKRTKRPTSPTAAPEVANHASSHSPPAANFAVGQPISRKVRTYVGNHQSRRADRRHP